MLKTVPCLWILSIYSKLVCPSLYIVFTGLNAFYHILFCRIYFYMFQFMNNWYLISVGVYTKWWGIWCLWLLGLSWVHESWYSNSDIYCVAKRFGNLYWEMRFNQISGEQPSFLNLDYQSFILCRNLWTGEAWKEKAICSFWQ